jgi:G3E family GTPase
MGRTMVDSQPCAAYVQPMEPIPVTLLTGFLGSGKTSLVSRVLADPRFSDTAVVINEFGEVGLDHVLVEAAPETIVEMTSGCLCCTVRGDIRQSLVMLLERSERGELPLFSRLIIETTGLADPVPILHTLMADPRLVRRYRLAQVVTCVDAVNGLHTLATHEEAVKQVAVADRLLITKTDVQTLSLELRARLAQLNPSATSVQTQSADFDLRQLADDTAHFMPHAKSTDVLAWLKAERHMHDHDHPPHDVNRHSDSIRSFCIEIDKPMSRFAFSVAMELLAANQGADLLRVKGLVALEEHPDQPVVIHTVQHIMHPPVRLDRWPSADHRTRIVFITNGIAKETMQQFFTAWTSPPQSLSPAI